MKTSLSALLLGFSAITFVAVAVATPGGAPPGIGPGAQSMDCAKSKNKVRCESLNKKIELCKDKTDDAWRACMEPTAPAAKFTPPKARDCSKSRNKELCEAHAGALKACKDRVTRAEHRKCMAGQWPAQTPAPRKN